MQVVVHLLLKMVFVSSEAMLPHSVFIDLVPSALSITVLELSTQVYQTTKCQSLEFLYYLL